MGEEVVSQETAPGSQAEGGSELKRVLGFWSVWLIAINSVIGSGIFILPAIGASYSGPSSLVAWVVLALVSIYTAACFAELGALFPTAGGVYEFAKETYGRFPSYLVGWMEWLIGNLTTAMLIAGGVLYLIPSEGSAMNFFKIIVCILFILMFNYIAYRGVETSAAMLITFAVITVSSVIALTIMGFIRFDPGNFVPFFVEDGFGSNFSLIFLTLFFIAETFFGIESVLPLAEETIDPEKNIPKALMWGITAVCILAIVLVISSLGAFHWTEFSKFSAPYAEVAAAVLGDLGRKIITIVTYLVMVGAAAGWIVTTPRLLLALARDEVFPPQFSHLHPEYQSPYKGIIFQGIVQILFILIAFSSDSGYETLLHLLVPLVIVVMVISILCVPILRVREPEDERPFKAPFGIPGSIATCLFYIAIIVVWLIFDHSAIGTFALASTFVAIGIPIYLLIEMYFNPRAIVKVNDWLAHITLFAESYSLPVRIREAILFLLGDLQKKKVLEYGCSVGTLTLALAEAVGPEGYVYASDHSERSLHIANKRMKRKGHTHVQVLHDEEHTNRIHPEIPLVDSVVSVGMIGYVQDMEKVLIDINRRLAVGGKICFLDYDNYFNIIPNVDWLSKDKYVKDLFLKTGFRVSITKKEGLFWQYVFIYGEKINDVDVEHFHYDKTVEELEEDIKNIPVHDSTSLPTSGEVHHPAKDDHF